MCAMLDIHGDRRCATAASADQCTRVDGNSSEHIGTCTGKSIRHAGAVAVAHGEDEVLVDAKTILDGVKHGVGEGDISAVCVCPTLVGRIARAIRSFEETFGHDVDDAVVTVERREAVVRRCITAVDNLTGAAVGPMKLEDEAVLFVAVVVRWQADVVRTVDTIDIHCVIAIGDGRIFTASRRSQRRDTS